MSDKDDLPVLEGNASSEGMSEKPDTSMASGERMDFVDITALIRSIQRAEGNPDCFRMPQGYCEKVDCFWHLYCMESSQTINRQET